MARTGREVLLEVLADEGVRHVFGNPGTTELPFVDELAVHPELEYVLALQENTAVAMADGYAQATGRPSFLNLHTSAGLGGGIGNLTNALANRTPMVVTAGQQDRRHLVADPLLSGDLVGLARPVSKWQHEVRHLGELATVLRRAFTDAVTPPAGPVFVSIPMDVLDESGEVTVAPKSHVERGASAGGLDELARLLTEAAPPGSPRTGMAMVVGDEVSAAGAQRAAVELAELLGCVVYGAPLYSTVCFPTDHPLWAGMLPPFASMVNATLSAFRRVFVVGAQAFLVYPYTPGPALPEGTELLHLDADASQIGRTFPTRLGLVGDVRASLEALVPLVARRADRRAAAAVLAAKSEAQRQSIEAFDQMALDRYDQVPMHPMAATHALLAALGPGGVVVDEAITTGLYVRGLHRTSTPGTYFFCRGGGLGWGIPAALGVKLARPELPVLCIVGDGSAMYTVQALWTAARYRIPVVVGVVNNRQYKILKDNLVGMGGRSAASGTFVAMDIDDPPVDYVGLARGLGVDAALVEKAADVTDAARAAFESGKPWLLELPISTG